ncbi:hypothetical protein HOT31_gp053 [Microbacterium phage Hendrix]|uniref:Uncharacterized protein n=1 Tax=Microbacterium phage Hendrix TaxID=2182341 RepID=A0A2U8UU78_9CAUD|nr:hypothetical protein HOT31_gp053 [Microbacterium phage Hendrix]AWN07724.1 hypothetical protein PBI_HENDRIX_53 [Microbacterium phage Hendrix]
MSAFGAAAEKPAQPQLSDNEVMAATHAEMERGEISTSVPMNDEFLIIEDTFVQVALRSEVQDALQKWMRSHADELDEVLKPFGLSQQDVLMPTFERPVRNGEMSQGRFGADRHRRFV